MQHKALDVFQRDVFREVPQPNGLRNPSNIDYPAGPGGCPNLQVNVVAQMSRKTVSHGKNPRFQERFIPHIQHVPYRLEWQAEFEKLWY
ncbi:hypothetical protein [Mesorhizobium sp.]|uniref:hypothetical protein n=1 Tax=Mesorhizobium sp. TaxID=1871066 RepID=UPI00121E2C8A|nr:hypothetical protein [Mesorhizobium sp.]TIO09491.1 MAG: hypothetical protein E5X88_09170 [Mesorhizobium sp.]TIO29084.1 MAG: hypothetical protein E5X89_32405 [Mesorhizobium sp.]TIP08102.1 MAG: hypothetical protein E5X73_33545 [Mesorhizobium sp.]